MSGVLKPPGREWQWNGREHHIRNRREERELEQEKFSEDLARINDKPPAPITRQEFIKELDSIVEKYDLTTPGFMEANKCLFSIIRLYERYVYWLEHELNFLQNLPMPGDDEDIPIPDLTNQNSLLSAIVKIGEAHNKHILR